MRLGAALFDLESGTDARQEFKSGGSFPQVFPKYFLSQSKKTNRVAIPLTKREKEVLMLLPRGLTAKAMASELFLTEATIKSHLAAIFRKFEVANRTQAIAIAVESKILTF